MGSQIDMRVLYCKLEDLEALEAYYIRLFRPKYNGRGKYRGDGVFKPIAFRRVSFERPLNEYRGVHHRVMIERG
jgi:hypothetical protein